MSIEKLARPDLWCQAGYKSQSGDRAAVLRLNCNENPWPPEGASDPLINRYPEKQPGELLDRLARLYGVRPDNLLVTRGADDGIDALIRSFCRPGIDSIVQCSPAFVMYEFFARLQSVQVYDVPLDPSRDFNVEFAELGKHKTSKLFFLCNPNNPTGSLADPGAVLDFAEQVQERALVIVDEAYIEFASVESLAAMAVDLPNLVVLRTLSKAWSLAGARLGVVVGNADLISYLHATTSPYPLSRSAVSTALDATEPSSVVTARQRIEELKAQRDILQSSLIDVPFVQQVFPSEANFLLVRIADCQRFLDFMKLHGVLLRDQSSQTGLDNCVRISVGTSQEMTRLLETMNKYQEDLV